MTIPFSPPCAGFFFVKELTAMKKFSAKSIFIIASLTYLTLAQAEIQCNEKKTNEIFSGNSFYKPTQNVSCSESILNIGGQISADVGRMTFKIEGEGTTKNDIGHLHHAILTSDLKISPALQGHLTLNAYQDSKGYANTDEVHAYPPNDTKIDESWLYYQTEHSPIYFKIGKMFAPFSQYQNPYTPTPSSTQVVTQFNTQIAEAGWTNKKGVSASIYTYMLNSTNTSRRYAFGAQGTFKGALQTNLNIFAKLGMISDYRSIYSIVTPASGTNTANFDLSETFFEPDLTIQRKAAINLTLTAQIHNFNAGLSYFHTPKLVADDANTKIHMWGIHGAYDTHLSNVPIKAGLDWEKTENGAQGLTTLGKHFKIYASVSLNKHVETGISWDRYKSSASNSHIKFLMATATFSF